MNGNIWEWTSTIFPEEVFVGSEYAGQKVAHMRGGGFFNKELALRCSGRWAGWPVTHRSLGTGFRVVCEKEPTSVTAGGKQ